MYNFEYHSPASAGDAETVAKKASDGKFLAGGMTLLPTIKLRLANPSDLVDLAKIGDLKGIKVDGGTVTIGAMTPHCEVANSAEIAKALPALAKLAGTIGDSQVRHRGTIGGSIANNDPAADYPAAIVGLGATVHTTKRQIAGDDFFTGLFETALEEGELITAVSFPVPDRAAYMKFPNPASRFAIVGVMVSSGSQGTRVAVTGAGACVFRVSEMEAALEKSFSADAVAGIAIADDELNADIHASAPYRAHLVTVMAKRAVAEALG